MSPTVPFLPAPWTSPQGVLRSLTVPPAAEPLTLEQGKLRAGLDWAPGDARDELMKDFIAAARTKVEQDTGLALLAQTWRLEVTALVAPGLVPLPSQALPLRVLSIVNEDGSLTPIVPIIVAGGRSLAIDVPAPYVLQVESGWPDVAALKLTGAGLYQAVGLLTAHLATVGRDLTITGTIVTSTPYGYDAAIDPYRLVWLP